MHRVPVIRRRDGAYDRHGGFCVERARAYNESGSVFRGFVPKMGFEIDIDDLHRVTYGFGRDDALIVSPSAESRHSHEGELPEFRQVVVSAVDEFGDGSPQRFENSRPCLFFRKRNAGVH